MADEAARRFLAALDEPALLLTPAGAVRHANAGALRLLGGPLAGRRLAGLAADPPEAVATLLRRAAGSTQALPGSLRLRTPDGGERRCRCRGARVGGAGEPLLLLRLEDAAHDRFRPLTEKIVALNAGIRRSERDRSRLEAALEQKGTLLRELHHRVKNNLQTLLGILAIAEKGAAAPEARDAIRDARARVEAMAVLQRLLYQQDDLASVDGFAFLAELCATVERAFRRPGIAVRVAPAEVTLDLDVAAAAGLIANELLTNAFKHAFPDRERGEVTVRLRRDGDDVALVVEDDGRGLGRQPAGGTGLALVRGLARQHGGTCVVEGEGGVRCSVVLRGRAEPGPPPPRERRASPGGPIPAG
jgi:two-component sensor histidine kinase